MGATSGAVRPKMKIPAPLASHLPRRLVVLGEVPLEGHALERTDNSAPRVAAERRYASGEGSTKAQATTSHYVHSTNAMHSPSPPARGSPPRPLRPLSPRTASEDGDHEDDLYKYAAAAHARVAPRLQAATWQRPSTNTPQLSYPSAQVGDGTRCERSGVASNEPATPRHWQRQPSLAGGSVG